LEVGWEKKNNGKPISTSKGQNGERGERCKEKPKKDQYLSCNEVAQQQKIGRKQKKGEPVEKPGGLKG